MRIVFFGSSEFSIPVLSVLLNRHEVVQIVTTPEQKKGRGQKRSGTVVKEFAIQHQLPFLEPEKLSNPDFVAQIQNLNSDFLVVASYGKLIPSSIFKLPKIAALNVHPSLLPKHRGASPIQRAILEGDVKTGISIAEITKDLDAGDVFAQIETPIDLYENAHQLSERLSKLAAQLLLEVIEQQKNGNLKKSPQNLADATYAKKINKEEGKIDWSKPAQVIHNQVRGYDPWPGAFAFFQGKRLKILETELLQTKQETIPASIVSIDRDGICVQTQSGSIRLKRVQLEGRKEVGAYEFALGQRIKKEDRFQ